jgi:pimeloyl-ACP methyl ester carboxylesterase
MNSSGKAKTLQPSASVPDVKRRRTWRRRLGEWTLALVFIYVVLVGVLLLFENRLVYLATAAADDWSPPEDFIAEDVELQSADGTPLHGWWCPRRSGRSGRSFPDRGAILFCHGQGGNLSHRGWLVPVLQKLDAPVFLFDYPGFGKSGGRPSEAGCYAAADAAYDWLVETKKIPPREILIVGKSLGGGVAVDLATRRPHRALILSMTFSSLPEVAEHLLPFVPARLVMRNRFNNLEKIGRCKAPVFIAHGTLDRKIPASQAERLFAAAPSPKRYLAMQGVGHGWPCFSEECLAEIRTFLHELDQAKPFQ